MIKKLLCWIIGHKWQKVWFDEVHCKGQGKVCLRCNFQERPDGCHSAEESVFKKPKCEICEYDKMIAEAKDGDMIPVSQKCVNCYKLRQEREGIYYPQQGQKIQADKPAIITKADTNTEDSVIESILAVHEQIHNKKMENE